MKTIKCKEHEFISSYGNVYNDGVICYYGNCKHCGIEMTMTGKIDENKNGLVTIMTMDGKYRINKELKNGQISNSS